MRIEVAYQRVHISNFVITSNDYTLSVEKLKRYIYLILQMITYKPWKGLRLYNRNSLT